MASAMTPLLRNRVAYGLSGAVALGASGYLFRDLADISQWVIKTDRNDVFWTFQHRHKIVALSAASALANSAVAFKTRCFPLPLWAAVNGATAFMVFSGYVNPELMMRPRNKNAVFVSNDRILDLLKPEETVIVVHVRGSEPRAFPDSQVLRPHTVRAGTTKEGTPVTMTYCGLTHLGIAFETPPHEDGREVELVPLTQLENNLVLLDTTTGHVGHQINGVDEMCVREKLGLDSHHETKRKPSEAQLDSFQLHGSQQGKEVPTWRMSLGSFIRTYPKGDVFINDYKMFKNLKNPVKSVYDSMIDTIFMYAVSTQATHPEPVFPTLENIDPRLPPKELVWAFNVGDDYVAMTETHVRNGANGLRNISVSGVPVVAAWDSDAGSLGIWLRPSAKVINDSINVHGRITGQEKPLERLSTVKNGAFWVVWANFFPKTRVNPEN